MEWFEIVLSYLDVNTIKVVCFVAMLVCVVIEFIATGQIKKSMEVIKSMTLEQRQKANSKIVGEKFDNMVDDLEYNEDTKIVEKKGKKDIQAFIDSQLNSSLDVFLQRFSEDDEKNQEDLTIANNNNETAYDAMLNAAMVAEEYAKAHNMGNASFIEIMQAINNEHKKQSANPIKELSEDEKKTVEEKSE